MVDRLDKRRVKSREMMVCIGATSVCVASSIGPGRMPRFADVPLGVALCQASTIMTPGAIMAVLCWC